LFWRISIFFAVVVITVKVKNVVALQQRFNILLFFSASSDM